MSLPNPDMNFTAFDILTAEEMNQLVANIEALSDGTGLENASVTADKLTLGGSSNVVTTLESTSSGTFTNLTTAGPAVTVNVPSTGMVLISFSSRLSQSTVNGAAVVGVNITGANTISPSDDLFHISSTADASSTNSITKLLTGLTPGSTTFTLQYRRQAGSGTSAFAQRRIVVIPIG